MEPSSSEAIIDLDATKTADSRTEAIHTFYLNANGNIFIDKHTCDLLDLGERYNLVLVKERETGRYMLEIRSPYDNSHTSNDGIL